MSIEEYRMKIKQQTESGERRPRPLCLPDEPVLNANGNPISRYQHGKNLLIYRNSLRKGRWNK